MDKDFEKTYHDVETNHWWFKSRRAYLLDLINKLPRNSKVLDIGCSSGVFLKELKEMGFDEKNLFGIDISEVAIENAKQNGLENTFVMDAQNITLDEKFDVIIASDCLEHLKEDEKALKNWYELLNKNGVAFIFVPAFMSLWSYHDEYNMHYRRYTNSELKSKLEKEGFEIQKSSYWNFFLCIPVYIFRKIASLSKAKKPESSDITVGNSFINAMLYQLIVFENKLLKILNFPFGVSTFCVVRKK